MSALDRLKEAAFHQIALVDREALARWKEDWNMPLECGPDYEFADDLIASGILRPMPTREAIALVLCEADGLVWELQANPQTSGNGDNNQEAYLHAADAILALIEGAKT